MSLGACSTCVSEGRDGVRGLGAGRAVVEAGGFAGV